MKKDLELRLEDDLEFETIDGDGEGVIKIYNNRALVREKCYKSFAPLFTILK
jgi:hypothetical protein